MIGRRRLKSNLLVLLAVSVFLLGIHFMMLDDYVYRQITDVRVFRSSSGQFEAYSKEFVKRRSFEYTSTPQERLTEAFFEELKFEDLGFSEKRTTLAPGGKNETKPDVKVQRTIRFKSNATDSGRSNSTKSKSVAVDKAPPATHNKTIFEEYDISRVKISILTDDVPINKTWFSIRWHNSFYPLLMNNEQLCRLPNGTRPFLLILVPSVRDNTKTRDVIRNTWGKLAYNGGYWAGTKIEEPVRLMFLLGGAAYSQQFRDAVRRENDKHGDIVVSDFVDSYRNLSIKIANGIHWVSKFCDGVSHMAKVDEDTFVHVPQLIKSIKIAERKSKTFVMGHAHRKSKPEVVRKGRWKVGSEYPLPHYPRYVYGHSYVISGPAINPILKTYRKVPVVPNEDAFITGILAKLSNVTRFSNDAFASIRLGREILCSVARGYYISVTQCCDDHLRKIYRDAVHKECDSRSIYLYPVCWCRFYHKMSNWLYSRNLCDIKWTLAERARREGWV